MKKGQAALEFLMTYGWAILVVLVVIGALAYFGVLNPNILVPEKCTLQTGIACKDFKLNSTSLLINIENGMGKGIVITNISINSTGNTGECYAAFTNLTGGVGGGFVAINHTSEYEWWNVSSGGSLIRNGNAATIFVNKNASTGACTITGTGRKLKADIEINYYFQDSSSAFTHTAGGEILAKLE